MRLAIIIRDYIEVLKPRATGLLTFIGICAAIVAGDGHPPLSRLLIVGLAVLLACAGADYDDLGSAGASIRLGVAVNDNLAGQTPEDG